MFEVSFDNTESDKAIIEKIIQRLREFDADERDPLNRSEEEYRQVRVSIAAAQANESSPFRLERLLSFDMVSFYHDIWGFYDHTSRDTGELLNCWLPRCGQRNGHD
ncbi:DUF6874 family protein [Saccharibacter floricola]|uniref:DUF6874 domain-containing protein n=1 Tax=Saccharibacter floricola DSM 15669 TaxID=1123227 RepID=A0ABQ0NWC5_9PROT|nr:hypothetical protein [Saccharibacter floricola]GBQ04962.1 hypothetical protein AA15669_0243 [Saccharibacter floricola DSM 15669]